MKAARATKTRTATPAAKLLAWYDAHRRVLPWRPLPGGRADPYAVWLSEIMLQQTTVRAVGPYYLKFLERWPTVAALAVTPLDDVLAAWAGLGYYSRARNLHACAQAVVANHGGIFPQSEAALLELPGVGAYTAAAIAAIAFGAKATPVDGNIERVVARLFAIEEEMPRAKPLLRARAAELTPATRAGDFAQAMMDLGSAICTPKRPFCNLCPLKADCLAFAKGIAETLPRRAPKAAQKTRYGAAFVALGGNTVLLQRRPPKGLLGGMMEVPSSPWEAAMPAKPLTHAPLKAKWTKAGKVEHTFTHFHLVLDIYVAHGVKENAKAGQWIARDALDDAGLPTLMRKVIARGLDDGGPLFRR